MCQQDFRNTTEKRSQQMMTRDTQSSPLSSRSPKPPPSSVHAPNPALHTSKDPWRGGGWGWGRGEKSARREETDFQSVG